MLSTTSPALRLQTTLITPGLGFGGFFFHMGYKTGTQVLMLHQPSCLLRCFYHILKSEDMCASPKEKVAETHVAVVVVVLISFNTLALEGFG